MSEYKQISQISQREKLNKLFYFLRKIFVVKTFISPYVYMDYKLKDKSAKVFKVFYVLKTFLYKFIYLSSLMIVSVLLNQATQAIDFFKNSPLLEINQISIFFGLWAALLFAGNYKSKLLNYDKFKNTLLFSFQVPFKNIYAYELREMAVDRVIYSIVLLAYISLALERIPLAIFTVVMVFFAMYFAESFTILLSHKIKRELNTGEASFMILTAFGLIFFFSIFKLNTLYKLAIILVLCLAYIVFSYHYIFNEDSMEKLNRLMTQNIVKSRERLNEVENLNLASVKMDDEIDISESGDFIKEANGYTLFNKIFLSRHRRLWYKPLRNQSIVILVFLLALSLYLFLAPYLDPKILLTPETNFKDIYFFITKAFLFFFYFAGTGEKLSQAYYKNADYSLLHYAFYRRRETIWLQYLSRAKSAMLMALVPFMILSIFGFVWVLSFPDLIIIDLLAFLINILVISLFFNLHYLFLYYIIQPFNAKLEAKSIVYILANVIIYIFVFNSSEFLSHNYSAIVLALFFLVYSLISVVLVRMFAHKTFVYKD